MQVKHLDWEAFALAVPVGLLAAGLLMVNNVRDIDTDRRAGKRTLAVRLGRDRARIVFAVTVYLAYVLVPVTWAFGPLGPWLLLAWLTLPLGRPRRARGPQPHRRTLAQRRARPDRDAAARVLHAAGRGRAPEPVRVNAMLPGR